MLLEKISQYGIDNRLIKSYLQNRHQFTEINSTRSETSKLLCGVPQGSILGPLFFLIFVNDLQHHIDCTGLLFADDTTLLIHAPDNNELISKTNNVILQAARWFQGNKLTVHPEKTNFMVFNATNRDQLNNKILWGNILLERIGRGQKEETVKYVGIKIDEDLAFKIHTDFVAQKMKQNSYLISCNKNYLPFSTRKLLYNALIRPLMDFGAEIWGHANINLIKKIQKNIIRHVVKSKNFIDHTNQHFRSEERRVGEGDLGWVCRCVVAGS